jgi:TonB family protein
MRLEFRSGAAGKQSGLCVAFLALSLVVGVAADQVQDRQAGGAKEEVGLTKLFPPVYPPLARQARITGDVVVKLQVRQDGGVESAEVPSGHPMLRQAALESAQKSKFECSRCRERTTAYSLIYTFGLQEGDRCVDGRKYVRAAKCFYLWRCKWHDAPPRPPVIGELPGRVIILVASPCWEP